MRRVVYADSVVLYQMLSAPARPQQHSGGGFQGFDAPAASPARIQSPSRGTGIGEAGGMSAGEGRGPDLSRSGALAGLSGQAGLAPAPAVGHPSHGLAHEFSSPTRHSAGGSGAGGSGAVHLGGRGVGQATPPPAGPGSRSPSPRKEDRPWETQHIEYSPE